MQPARQWGRAAQWALVGFVSLVSWIGPGSAASPEQAPPIPPGMARVWFVQPLVPGSSFYAPMLSVNGQNIAISPEGTAFYRDYAPGNYMFGVENCAPEPQTSQQLTIAAGQQFALQVETDNEDIAFDCTVYYLDQVEPYNVPMVFAPLRYLGRNGG